jgi:hypothetical protein
LRESLILEAARFQALHRNRPDLARQWLDLDSSGKSNAKRFLPEALVLHRENRQREALAKIEEGLAVYREMPEGWDAIRCAGTGKAKEQSFRDLRDRRPCPR